MKRRLPRELAILGADLETAIERAVARRRSRRTAFLNAVATVMVAVPLAFAVAAAELTPSATPPDAGSSLAPPVIVWETGLPVAVAHIPDENVVSLRREVCLDANDCRSPHPFILAEPPGKL